MHESKANVNYSATICWAVVWLSALPHRPCDFPAREASKRDHRRERDGAGRAGRDPHRRRLRHAAVPHAGWQRHAVLQQGEDVTPAVVGTLAGRGLGDRINQLFHCRHDTPSKHKGGPNWPLRFGENTDIMWLWALRRASFVSQISKSFLFNLAAFFAPRSARAPRTWDVFPRCLAGYNFPRIPR